MRHGEGERRGAKREVVILLGWVPETLVKLSCGLIIINREKRHNLCYKLFVTLDFIITDTFFSCIFHQRAELSRSRY